MATKKFVWKKDLAVGISWIDEQHKHFFKLVNEIMEAAAKDRPRRKDLLICLAHLANHAFYHFDSEEKFLINSKYPDVKGHIAAHGRYREKIKIFLAHVRDEKTDIHQLADETAAFADDWLSRHMLGTDKEKTRFLKSTE